MSGLLYCLYTNEIPLLHNIMNKNLYELMTNDPIFHFNKKIIHETINFLDDSSNVIGFPNTNEMKQYLTKFYRLLHSYYNINKLKVNSDKTKLMIGYKNKHKKELENFYFFANNDKIINQKSMKILGFTLRYDNNMDTQIGKTCANLHYRLNNIRKLNVYTSFSSRIVFVKSLVIGKLIYAMPLYTQITKKQLSMIHKVIMTSGRIIIGNYCFKQSIRYILNKCKMLKADKLIAFSSINFINKIIFKKTPANNYSLF